MAHHCAAINRNECKGEKYKGRLKMNHVNGNGRILLARNIVTYKHNCKIYDLCDFHFAKCVSHLDIDIRSLNKIQGSSSNPISQMALNYFDMFEEQKRLVDDFKIF